MSGASRIFSGVELTWRVLAALGATGLPVEYNTYGFNGLHSKFLIQGSCYDLNCDHLHIVEMALSSSWCLAFERQNPPVRLLPWI